MVVKIPEEIYNRYMNYTENYVDFMFFGTEEKVVRAIRNGTPLSKGHGRLIDADAFLKENKDYTGWILCSDAWGGENAYKDTLEDLINEAPTIIGPDGR